MLSKSPGYERSSPRPSILVVDDVPANLLAMERLLSRIDAEVVTAGSGNQALAECVARDFALVLLDIQMPEMDGYEVAELLRGEEKTQHLPIIFVTASYADEYHRLRGYGAGAVDYLEKPIHPEILLSKVQIFLDLHDSRHRLERALAETERNVQAARDSEARLRHTILDAPIPIMLHAEDGEIILLSRRWAELTGIAADDLTNLSQWRARVVGEDEGGLSRYFSQCYTATSPLERQMEVITAANERLIWDMRSGPVQPLADGRRLAVSMAVDITAAWRARRELEASSLDLKRSNQELETFAYVASHDLREPLRMVNSFLTLLERHMEGKLSEEDRELFHFASEGARRMDRLVLDLLELSRVGHGDMPQGSVDMTIVLMAALDNLAVSIAESGAVIECPQTLPKLSGRKSELIQLFQNIIGNSIKYKSNYRITNISISYDDTGDSYVFSVTDNGIGIEDGYTELVFGVFQRLHLRSEYPGTGIGLAICKKIVESHGGEIWITSVPDEYTTVSFKLPKQEVIPVFCPIGNWFRK